MIRWTLGKKITMIPLVMALLMVLVGTFLWVGLDEIHHNVDQVQQVMVPEAQISNRMMENLLQRRNIVERYLRTRDPLQIELFQLNVAQAGEILDDMRDLPLDPQQQQSLDVVANINHAFNETFSQQLVQTVTQLEVLQQKVLKTELPMVSQKLADVAALTGQEHGAIQLAAWKVMYHLEVSAAFINQLLRKHQATDYDRLTMELLAAEVNALKLNDALQKAGVEGEVRYIAQQVPAEIDAIRKEVVETHHLIKKEGQILNEVLLPLSSDFLNSVKRIQQLVWNHLYMTSEKNVELVENSVVGLVVATLAAVVIGLVLSTLITRQIVRPVRQLADTMGEVRQRADFSRQVEGQNSTDEVGEMVVAFNGLMSSIDRAISGVNDTVGAMAKGDYSARVAGDYEGDLARLKESVNLSADRVGSAVSEINSVMEELAQGRFKRRVEAELEGDLDRLKDNINHAVGGVQISIQSISECMASVAEGDFTKRVTSEAQGDLRTLQGNINSALNDLDQAISEIGEIMQLLAAGDLRSMIENDYKGQLDVLKQAINRTIEGQAGIIRQVQGAVTSIQTGVNEIAAGNNDLASRTTEQAAALEQTSASLEQMTASVQQNENSANVANDLAASATNSAENGRVVIRQATEAMESIRSSSDRITEITSLIDGIAFQTNLLALNAAVEAARVGDHGRGFAVVAGEVRTLAQRSADATSEIKALIEESGARVNDGVSLVEQSNDAFEEINQSINRVSQVVVEIASSTREQSSGIGQVNQAMTDLDKTNQQNSALVEEAAAASESLSEQAEELSEVAAQFKIE